MNTIESIDFKSLIGQQKTMKMKMRLLALEHFKQGHSRTKRAMVKSGVQPLEPCLAECSQFHEYHLGTSRL